MINAQQNELYQERMDGMNEGWDARQTMEAMKIPVNEQEKYSKQI